MTRKKINTQTPKCHSGGTVAFRRKDWNIDEYSNILMVSHLFFRFAFVHICCLMQWSAYLWVFFYLFIIISFCLIRTCNQIAIWYWRLVQLLVRETQSLTWLGAKPILRVKQRRSERENSPVIFAHRVFKLRAHYKKRWALQAGFACRMKHLMQFNF